MGETCLGDWDSGIPGQHSAKRLNSSLHPKATKQRQARLKLKLSSGLDPLLCAHHQYSGALESSLSAGDTAQSVEYFPIIYEGPRLNPQHHISPIHPMPALKSLGQENWMFKIILG